MARKRTARSTRATAPGDKRSADLQARPLSPEPPLAELRRKAADRLHQLSRRLAAARADYEEALADCLRLRAACSDDGLPSAAPPDTTAHPEPPEPVPSQSSIEAEELRAHISALETKLCETERTLAAEQDTNRSLQAKLRDLETSLSRCRSASRPVDPPRPQASPAELADLQAELDHARATDAKLQQQIDGLLRFLDELSAVLSLSVDAPHGTPGT
jgi:hypothetical protein